MNKKIIAKVYPVTWSNGKATKYRAHIECAGIRIYGDPKYTKGKAQESLIQEVKKYEYAATQCLSQNELGKLTFKQV